MVKRRNPAVPEGAGDAPRLSQTFAPTWWLVAPCGQEGGRGAELRHDAEAEDVAVEAHRLVHVGDAQVDVADRRACGETLERLLGGIRELAQEIVDVERLRRHALEHLPSQSSRGRSA